MSRIYINNTIVELEEAVELHKTDKVVLRKIKSELKFRKIRQRNTNLISKIDVLIKGEEVAVHVPYKADLFTAELLDQKQRDKPEEVTTIKPPVPKPPFEKREKKVVPENYTVMKNEAKLAMDQANMQHKREEKKINYPTGFLHQNFEDMRTKLLDISGGRSRLINLDQSSKSFVRLVDELPDQLVKTLLQSKVMTLVPVPEPTTDELVRHGYLEWDEEENRFNQLKQDPSANEWAGVLGLKNDYELPEDSKHADNGRHEDLNLQSLIYEPALNLRLQKLSREAKTAIDETGNNILFLCLGFLEWADLDKSGKKRHAPLYMLPVEIVKEMKAGVSVYSLAYTGEDIIPNLTLREKLKRDFEIILPDVVDPNNEERLLSPEEYFQEVNALLARKNNDPNINQWRVRRFGTLATLSLGKLLMYLDLDPARWPNDGKDLLEHEVVKHFFHDGKRAIDGEGGLSGGTDYILDDVVDIHENYPMIEDADSSQMSALIDILKGNSMVVEGPPGTGKSQTITNLLAGAMAQGKTVLFVAEKQAALDVVKRRMDKAGLGDFCLDLHSDKAQKRLVLDSFNERMKNQGSHTHSVSDYDIQVQRYERAREQLQEYVLMVNEEWKATGLTIHEVLSAATRYGNSVAPLCFSDIAPEGISGSNFNKVLLDEELEKLERFYNYLSSVSQQLPDAGNWSSHPWYGVGNKALSSVSEDDIVKTLNAWTLDVERLNTAISDFYQGNQLDSVTVVSLTDIDIAIERWKEIPVLAGSEVVSAFSNISYSALPSLFAAAEKMKIVADGFIVAKGVFHKDIIDDFSQLIKIKQALLGLQNMGVLRSVTFDDISRSVDTAEQAKQLINRVLQARNELFPNIPPDLRAVFSGDKVGLTELAKFCEYAADLPAELLNQRDPIFDKENLVTLINRASTISKQLVDRGSLLSKDFFIDKLPDSVALIELSKVFEKTTFFSFVKPAWRDAKKTASAFIVHDKYEYKEMAEKLAGLASWADDINNFSGNEEYSRGLENHFKGVETDWNKVSQIALWYQKIRADYGIGFGRRVVLARELFCLPLDIFRGVRNLHEEGLSSAINKFLGKIEKLQGVFTVEKAFSEPGIDYSADLNPLQLFLFDIHSHMRCIQHSLVNANLAQNEVIAALKTLSEVKASMQAVQNLNISEQYFNAALNLHFPANGELPQDYRAFKQTIDYLKAVYNIELPALTQAVLACDSESSIAKLIEGSRVLIERHKVAMVSECCFFNLVETQREAWFKDSGYEIKNVIARNNSASMNVLWLDGWLKYLYAVSRMESAGFNKLKEHLLQSQGSLEQAKDAMKFAAYQAMAQEIYQQKPALSEHSGHEQTALREQFAKYDEKLKELQRKRVASIAAAVDIPKGTSGAKVAHYSGGYLLSHEVSKQRGHISIRHLVARAGDAMQAYKPCFMMSPMAVAKYLPPGAIDFDLVVMDEASQVKPEYALSCFARGKNVVVVGDPKQLPPTTFFERSVTNDDEDFEDAGVIGEAESILDAVGGHFKSRQLRWHYRSKHESLIEFSNHNFYDSNLVIFPSPWAESDEYGIKFSYIENGRFLNNVNSAESNAVVAALKVQFLERSHESVGIVAMNSKQRDQIESDLELAISQDSVFRLAYQNNQASADPLFIKNLENVQGDERDVIFISFTYGPKEKGSHQIPQRFGPINGNDGWRRLNVLFTRAKKRIQVYSSMTSGQILLTENSKRGVKSLKGYLEYAQTGRLVGQTGVQQKEPDSDFEIAVIEALSKHGFECVPQVGVAGFFIDLAVRDPGMPGRYLMGVECDGATYHSSKSTRDRDRVRQGVLEGLGWEIRRIWSTDWFKHPEAELKPIIEELKRMSTSIVDVVHEDRAIDIVTEMMVTEVSPKIEPYAPKTLKDRLISFASNIIAKEYPDTADERRLLRAEMIERLILDMPTSHEDFMVFIPAYLRSHTDTKEASTYLNDVLEIIAEYEELFANKNEH